MTICIGYVDSEAVYLTADSAVTSGQRLSHSFSSFGELQRNEAGITIQEAALKIMRHGNVAAAFAGDAKSAHQIFENFVAGAERMIPPPAAFENAWLSSTEPGQPAKTSALLGYFDSMGPHLIKFAEGGPTTGVQIKSGCIGNVDENTGRFFEMAVAELPAYIKSGSDRLVVTTTLLQRLTIFDNLMPHGIGGYIAGCWIGQPGLTWTPDTMHVLLRDELIDCTTNETVNMILTCERLDTCFVHNNKMPGFHGFGNSFGENRGLELREFVAKLLARQNEILPMIGSSNFSVDYVVFHNLPTGLSTMFSINGMNGRHIKHWFDPQLNQYRFQISERARDVVLRKTGGQIAPI